MAIGEQPIAYAAEITDDDAMRPAATGSLRSPPLAMALAPDGTLYAAGYFELHVGATPASLVRRDGDEWVVQSRFTGAGEIRALDIDEAGTVFVDGRFTDGPNLLQLRDGTWTAVGARVVAPVLALLAAGDALYVGEGDASASRVWRWDGAEWDQLGGDLGPALHALARVDGQLYVGGLDLVVGAPVARWDGADWVPAMSADVPAEIFDLAVAGDSLIAAGWLQLDDAALGGVAWLDGTEWRTLGGGVSGAVYDVEVTARGILLGGLFEVAGNVPSWALARFEPR